MPRKQRLVHAWGLMHYGDRFGEPLCRVKAMSRLIGPVNPGDVVTCLWCAIERRIDG